jgi:putative toxin-antitoxin system antitoxin component (TIGR02293 family)
MATSSIEDISVAGLLGGKKVLGQVTNPADIQHAIREGLPYAALEALARVLELNHVDITGVLGIAPRTLARRKHDRHLSPIESDRLYRLAHITQFVAEALGGVEQACEWLSRANRALGGATPLSMLDTEIGTRQVEQAIVRINHGMHS